MRVYGNLMNRLGEHSLNPTPDVGMGATVFAYTDRYAGTVVKVSPSGKTVWVQEDMAVRQDHNGMSEVQSWAFAPNPDGRVWTLRKRADGTFREVGTGNGAALGTRDKYYDFSF